MQPTTYQTLYLIPLLPLIGAAILTVFGRKMPRELVSVIALSSVLASFAIVCFATQHLLRADRPLEDVLYSWMAVGRWRFDLAFGLDRLSATLMLVVTGVGFLIHLYSTEYMHDEPAYARYFAYLNFFIFAMSVLVLGRSLPVMFIGWEGVGLASYLLIGFWYQDEEKAKAGKKAFIVNRIGDFGFLLGTFTLIGLFGTADFVQLRQTIETLVARPGGLDLAETLSQGIFAGHTIGFVITGACLLLFVGATGKSAQMPLYVWLPDAMAGPTPVSALIHAATMVTAGVYMIARLHFIFDLAPAALNVVAWVGGITALFAATIGLAQNDIKKVLAYSTVSQLGYMFLGVGVGAYGAAAFHLVTHAFFKACLFLGSGAVIHALHGEQDMRKMGGLRTELPWVYRTFLVSTLALAGVFPLSGFFSKDNILANAFAKNPALWALGFMGAGLTALYMARLVCLTFYGTSRTVDAHGHHVHVHVPGKAMTAPLVILAVLAAVAGFANLPEVMAHLIHAPGSAFETFLAPSVGLASALRQVDAQGNVTMALSHGTEWALIAASIGMAFVGLFVGWSIFKDGPSPTMESLTKGGLGGALDKLLANKWYIDEIYQAVIVTPLRGMSSLLSSIVDPWFIDGVFVRGSGFAVMSLGRFLGRLQTGNVQSYAAVFVVAIALILIWTVR